MAGGEEASVGFEFHRREERRQRACFPRRDPGTRGAVGTERRLDLLGVRGELEGEEGFDLHVAGSNMFSRVRVDLRGKCRTYVTVDEGRCLGVVEELPVAEDWVAEFLFAVGVDVVD